MAALATVGDLELFVGPQGDPLRANRLIEMASAVAERWAGRRFAQVTETRTLRLDDGRLPDGPVVSVASVVDSGGTALSGYTLDGERLNGPYTGGLCGTYTVTYTHGFDPIPDDVVAAVCLIAAETITAPSAWLTQQETIGPFSHSLRQAGLAVGPGAADLLAPYRRRPQSVEMARAH